MTCSDQTWPVIRLKKLPGLLSLMPELSLLRLTVISIDTHILVVFRSLNHEVQRPFHLLLHIGQKLDFFKIIIIFWITPGDVHDLLLAPRSWITPCSLWDHRGSNLSWPSTRQACVLYSMYFFDPVSLKFKTEDSHWKHLAEFCMQIILQNIVFLYPSRLLSMSMKKFSVKI